MTDRAITHLCITKFYTVVKSHQKRRWRRCCTTSTGTCSMRQSHSNHCNSWGYDLISLAAVVWHHTAALRCRAAALRCHSSSDSDTATRDLKMLQRLWNCHIVLLYELCDCCTALHQTENFRRKRRALCANPRHKIIHNPCYVLYVCFRAVLIL